MGDRNRSEIQKPVKNTLLSGASHGFPFETFQGSSLLIPVSEHSPSVLNDSVGDVNKSESKELIHTETVTRLAETVGMTSLEGTPNPAESKNVTQTSNQGYTGIFSSFFGGGGQKKPEQDCSENQRKNSDQVSLSSVSSTPRSSSPFVTIPNFQTFSPTLQVPTSVPENAQSENSSSLEFSQSSTSLFSQTQSAAQSSFGTTVPSQTDVSAENSVESFSLPESSSKSPFQTHFPVSQASKELSQAEQSQIQNFFKDNSNSDIDLVLNSQSNPPQNLGFESFYSPVSQSTPSGTVLPKAQSAVELIGAASSPAPVGPPAGPPVYSPSQSQSAAPQFYQTRTGSVDSFKSLQQPPPVGLPSSLSAGPPLSGAAPPMSSSSSLKNYRRDHHKRLGYAPVPGLTSNTAVSSSYLQPRDDFSKSVSSFSLMMSPPGNLQKAPAGSSSQPNLKLPGVSSDSSLPSGSTSSVQTFFNPLPPTAATNATESQSAFYSTESLKQSDTTISSALSESSSQVTFPESRTSSVAFTSVNPAVNNPQPFFPPQFQPSNSTYVVNSGTFSPPKMSTREESLNLPSVPKERSPSPRIIPDSLNNLANLGTSGVIYRPAYHHWFFKIETKDGKEIWQPFSMTDSLALEQAFNSETLTPDTIVATDGGRYDVNVTNRMRTAVYWEEEPKTVRRCSWYYRSSTESRLHPYDENTAYYLEEEYKKSVVSNSWGRKVDLPSGDYIIMYGANSMSLFQNIPQSPDAWEAETDFAAPKPTRPKFVKRGVLDELEIDEGESPVVDHLIFVVHGIGSVCDFKFRTIEEAGDLNCLLDVCQFPNVKIPKVNGFRTKSLQLINSHFRSSVEQGVVNRVEILPVSWHKNLHGEATGVDKKLQTITLKSIPRLRSFANDTLLDILFYTSPVYCQNIVQQVGREVNTLFAKFKSRNPNFKGGVSLVGHSLGSLILFDILCHQKAPSLRMENIHENTKTNVVEHEVTTISPDKKKRSLSRNVSYVIGPAGTGQPFIEYPQLQFHPVAFFAMGSPIGMFVTVRGIDSLGLDFCLPTCSRFFNVFHPFDPVAYRIEALINPELAEKRAVLIPHHKGRKRMHLELKETMARVGADLKQRLVDSVRSTWNTVYQLTMFGRADDGLEQEVDRVIEKQLERQQSESAAHCINETEDTDCNSGRLNLGRRIDYVLQEAPLESFNEYVSAVLSHGIYWDSEDTMLLILKEIYGTAGISPDNQQTGGSGGNDDTPSTSEVEIATDMPSTSQGPPPSYGFR